MEFKSETFTITDDKGLSWALKKLKEIDREEKQTNDLAEHEHYIIETWHGRELKRITDDRSYFEGLINLYATKQKKLNPKWKTSTPHGSISYRKQPPKWNYSEGALRSISDAGLTKYIRTTEELDKNAIKDATHVLEGGSVLDIETGMVLDGITVTEQEDKIIIKLGSDE